MTRRNAAHAQARSIAGEGSRKKEQEGGSNEDHNPACGPAECRYRYEAMAQPGSASEPEWYVRNRIVALLDYLSRLQQR